VQTLSHATPKARKAHTCQMCWRTIDVGEIYECQTNINDNTLYTWKNCTQCNVFYGLEDYDGDGIGYDTVDNWEPGNTYDLRLKVLWHKKWRRKDGTLYPISLTNPDTIGEEDLPVETS
jgi:hypothetical protein